MDQVPTQPQPSRKERRRAISRLLLGLLITAFGGTVLYLTSIASTLVFARTSARKVNAEIHRTCFGIVPLPDRQVSDLQRAELREYKSWGRRSPPTRYAIVLQTASRPVEVSTVSGNRDRTAETVRQINGFLRDPAATTLTVRVPSAGWALLVPGLIVASGLLVMVESGWTLAKGRAKTSHGRTRG